MIKYHMPTKIYEGVNVVKLNKNLLSDYGKRALVVTGKRSSKMNGSLADVEAVLNDLGVEYNIFDEVEENPPVENIEAGAKKGMSADYIIGVGGGSPIDAAKSIAILVSNPGKDAYELLFKTSGSKSLPVIAIPTTAGTGSETTPFSVLTDHKRKTKSNFSQSVFPDIAFLDIRYFMSMPKNVRVNTCIDTLTHLIESYMTVHANVYSDFIVEKGLYLWGTVKNDLGKDDMSMETMRVFMNASTFGGMAIAQTGTSLPHGMGYQLTYTHDIAHGKANGLVLVAYLKSCENQTKVLRVIQLLGFNNINEFDAYLQQMIGRLDIDQAAIMKYSKEMIANERKLRNHPDKVFLDDIVSIYKNSL